MISTFCHSLTSHKSRRRNRFCRWDLSGPLSRSIRSGWCSHWRKISLRPNLAVIIKNYIIDRIARGFVFLFVEHPGFHSRVGSCREMIHFTCKKMPRKNNYRLNSIDPVGILPGGGYPQISAHPDAFSVNILNL